MTENIKTKAVLFDFDGTIVDTNPLIIKSWQHMAVKFIGHELGMDEIFASFGIPLETCMQTIAGKNNLRVSPDYMDHMNRMNRMNRMVEDMVEAYREYQNNHGYEGVVVFDGIKETLSDLRKMGIKTGIVTSRINSSTYEMLDYFGLTGCFDTVIGADDTNIHKPDPYPAVICCKKLGVSPEDAIMVGDSVYDIQCGMNAGAKSCFVKWSACITAEKIIEIVCPDFIISSPQELISLV